jgi:short-subunit dehydrogenase
MTASITLITGASAGIGAALAAVFAEHGHALVLTARREALLAAVADAIEGTGRPRPRIIAADLARPEAAERIESELRATGLEVQFLVNNAGFGLVGNALECGRAEQLAMVDLNVRASTELSLRFTDSMARHKGGILNVASVASFMPGPGMGVYHATKAYMLSFSEALHQELKAHGVRVTCLCPGPVLTEFQARAGVATAKAISPFDVPATRVAAEGYRGLMRGKRIVVPGLIPKLLFALVPRVVPNSWLLPRLEARQLNRKR